MKKNDFAVFVDRDGTINVDVDFLSSPEQLSLIPRSAEAIRELNELHIPVIVITNQSGIARGYFTEEDLQKIHHTLNEQLQTHHAFVTDYFYCPHYPPISEKQGKYFVECECRKPKPGMLLQAQKKYHYNLQNSFLVGDKCMDIRAGKSVGAKSILVSTGYGKKEHPHCVNEIDFYATDLYDAVQYIKRWFK